MSEAPEDAGVVSLAARWYEKAREQAARDGAPPELVADVAELGELTARIEALAAQPPPEPEADGSDIVVRYERGAELQELNAQVADIMTRGAEDPAEAVVWQQVAADQREAAALARQAAGIVADAQPT
ncbi:MAG: hypothetical protein ACRDRJ_14065 [Streptosporangiaceae bacterium]